MVYSRHNIAKAGTVIICDGVGDAISWCKEMCSSEWFYEPSGLPVQKYSDLDYCDSYTFYFTSRVDNEMFEKAFALEMQLAVENTILDEK